MNLQFIVAERYVLNIYLKKLGKIKTSCLLTGSWYLKVDVKMC